MTLPSRHLSQLSAVTAAALVGMPIAAALARQADGGDGSANLREQLLISEAAIKGLTESLAVANGETELFKRKSDDLISRIESLGVISYGKEEDVLRKRLLAAVRDLRIVQKERDAAREHLVRLSESVLGMIKQCDAIGPKTRALVEEELRAANLITRDSKNTSENHRGLNNGTIVDVKPDLELVVADLGGREGVKTGMPFQIWRGDRQIASVRMVDVRETISGAIIQNVSPDAGTVRAGDSLRIDTTR